MNQISNEMMETNIVSSKIDLDAWIMPITWYNRDASFNLILFEVALNGQIIFVSQSKSNFAPLSEFRVNAHNNKNA